MSIELLHESNAASLFILRGLKDLIYFYRFLFLPTVGVSATKQQEAGKRTRVLVALPVLTGGAAAVSSWSSYLDAGAKAGQRVRGHRCTLKAGEVP